MVSKYKGEERGRGELFWSNAEPVLEGSGLLGGMPGNGEY